MIEDQEMISHAPADVTIRLFFSTYGEIAPGRWPGLCVSLD